MGSFEPMRMSLGLPATTTTLKLESPFDYNRAKMIVPRFCVEATDPAHGRMVSAFLQDHAVAAIEHQGILVYFTSKKLMLDCMNEISEKTVNSFCFKASGNLRPQLETQSGVMLVSAVSFLG